MWFGPKEETERALGSELDIKIEKVELGILKRRRLDIISE